MHAHNIGLEAQNGRIRIRVSVKSEIRIRIHTEVKIQKLYKHKIDHNGGLGAQNGALEDL